MKKIIFLLFAAFGSTLLQAQSLTFKASTGDADLDGFLTEVDAKAKADMNAFTKEVATDFNIVKSKVDQAIKIMSPGDLFMAAQLSVTSNKPFETVVEKYKANKGKGWGVIAKEMGIKPGSPEFHEMKKAMKSKGPKNKDKEKGKSAEKGAKGKGKKK